MKRCNWFGKGTGVSLAAASVMAVMLVSGTPVLAAGTDGGLQMSTNYPGVTVKAGETLNFSLDFSCPEGEAYDAALSVVNMPEEWTGYFKGDSNEITRVYVNGTPDTTDKAKKSTDFSLTVPEDAADGTYEVELKADAGSGNSDTLKLEVNVSQQQAVQSTFTSEYPEQEGASGTVFSFDTTIVNNRATEQSYSLAADVPQGWTATFTPSGETTNVASLNVDPESSKGVTVTITPTESVEKGDYTVPVTAISAQDNLKADLQVSITGTYDVSLSTPDGRLSLDAYANKTSSVTLSVTNNGNVDLNNLNLTSSAPTDWEVTFSESTIDVLEAGATKEITAYITPTKDVITGDYVTAVTISNSEASSEADFRVSVKTSTTWGLTAIGIIVVLAGILVIIFKKFGRR